MSAKSNVNVRSEIGILEGVILHFPGQEVKNMTPENAERALYSDILNLSVASREYRQFSDCLKKVTKTFQVRDLLTDILTNSEVKHELLSKIAFKENAADVVEELFEQTAEDISRQLIEGVMMKKDTLTSFLDPNRYSLRPLHNFFFTRDASMTIRDKILVGRMSSNVREREADIMESIFKHHPEFGVTTVNPENADKFDPKIAIEGGDVLVIKEDIFLIGTGPRTTSQGIDFILDELKKIGEKRYVIVQELPHQPESFIHLDMAFTMLDRDKCMVYEPLILMPNKYQTVMIEIDNGKVVSIRNVENILVALKSLGIDLEPLYCGGRGDQWVQEREQWHSGANFFAIGPGRVIGYERNDKTIEELNKHGFEVLPGVDVARGIISPDAYDKYVIAIDGSELSRGGGGCRCMTMPVRRQAVSW